MRIFIQFSLYLSEILLSAVEIAAGALVLRHYLRRKNQVHLLFFGVSLLIWGMATLITFNGDMFVSQGYKSFGEQLIGLYPIWINIGAIFFFCGLVDIYAARRKSLWYALAVISGLTIAALSSRSHLFVFGQVVPVSSAFQFITSYGFWLLTNIVTVVVAGRAFLHGKRNNSEYTQPDLMMVYGGIFSVIMAVISVIIIRLDVFQITAITYFLLTVGTVYKYIGIISIRHPEDKIRRKPLLAITSSLNMKVLVAVGLIYILLTFAIVTVVTQIFVGKSMSAQKDHTKDVLHLSAEHYSERVNSIAALTSLISSHDEALLALQGNQQAAKEMLILADYDNDFDIDVFDTNSVLQVSSKDDSYSRELGDLTLLIEAALTGEESAGTYQLWESGIWSTVAVAPVRDTQDNVAGVVVVSRPLGDWWSPICIDQAGVSVSGCGFVSGNNEPIVMVGQEVDLTTISRLRRSVSLGHSNSIGQDERLGEYFVESFKRTDGKNGELYYAFITQNDVDRAVLRIMSTVMLMALLVFVLFAFLLSFAIKLFTEPILQLQAAVRRFAMGDYGDQIEVRSTDEIGQLAESFNTMSETIKTRTASLNDSMQQQRDFLHHTAQEIKIPLNVFRWSLEMLRFGDAGALNNEQMELVENMNKTNERVQRLVGQLSEVTSIEREQVKLDRQQVSLTDLIDDVAGGLAVSIREKKINFYWKYPAKPMPYVMGDSDLLKKVLENVLSNAIKFTRNEGHIEIRLIRVNEDNMYDQQGSRVMISVTDNGVGIPRIQQKDIFNRFFRASNAVEKEVEGTGLGLYLSRHYVEMHGGSIWFESRAGIGTSFYITLPISQK